MVAQATTIAKIDHPHGKDSPSPWHACSAKSTKASLRRPTVWVSGLGRIGQCLGYAMSITHQRRVAWAFGVGCAVAACKDTTAERLLAARLAEACVINSDCLDPLVCVFERCHVACTEDRDCEADQRCVNGTDRINVCQLPDEIACETRGDCPGEQVCAEDLECRDFCAADADCSNREQICASGGVCASTIAEKDDPGLADLGETSAVDGEGEGQSSIEGGPDPAEEAGDDVETETDSGEGSTGAMLEPMGSTTSDVEATGGASTESGGEPEIPYIEPDDGTELVANDDRDNTIPMPAQASIVLPEDDEDWFSVTAPDDGRAHIIHLTITQESGVRTSLQAVAQEDFSSPGDLGLGLQPGVSGSAFVSIGPGSTMLLRFYIVTNSGFGRANISFELLAEDDPYEPNNDENEARPIPLNTDISAQIIEPYTSLTDRTIDDWYEVELAAGEATLEIVENPNSGRIAFEFVSSLGVSEAIANPNAGVRGPFPFTLDESGTYFIRATRSIFAMDGYAAFTSGAIQEHMAGPYVFRIEQGTL